MEQKFISLAEQRKAAAKRYYEKHKQKILEKAKAKYKEKGPRAVTNLTTEELRLKRKAYRARYVAKSRYATKERRLEDLLKSVKARAISKNMEFNIDSADLAIPDTCPLLGIKIVWDVPTGGPVPNSPSIDRIDNTKGYVKGNVHVISYKANALKSNATLEELDLLVQNLKFLTLKSTT